MRPTSARPLVAVSLKAYFGQRQTIRWARGALDAIARHRDVDVVVFPVVTALTQVSDVLGGVAEVGVQKVSYLPVGAHTGELPASVAAECGARYAEIAHAERRRYFAEDDRQFRAEVGAVVGAGLTPLVCVGEPARTHPLAAVETCTAALGAVDAPSGSVVAYEPEWAIGADAPAPVAHVREVLAGIRRAAERSGRRYRLIYGGAAGSGTFESLAGVADGLFLGRRAHDVTAFADVLDEVSRSADAGPAEWAASSGA